MVAGQTVKMWVIPRGPGADAMSRISIDVTPEEHQKLKALAALQGKSIREFVLECTLGSAGVNEALSELEELLEERLRRSKKQLSAKTVKDILEVVRRDRGGEDA